MKRALVSGGSGDIGGAICRRLAQAGLHVIVHANTNRARAEVVLEDIRKAGGSGEVVVFDITDVAATNQCVDEVLGAGPVQVLVHNAGVHIDAPLAGMRPEQWRQVIEVNLNGFYNLSQPLLLPMIRTRWGRVIAVSSVSAVIGNRGQSNYAAAKAGLHGAVRSLALEVASRGVTANAVAPGIIEGVVADRAFGQEKIKALVPMRRAGRADEVAALVAFLASDDAAYISGQVVSINGAMG